MIFEIRVYSLLTVLIYILMFYIGVRYIFFDEGIGIIGIGRFLVSEVRHEIFKLYSSFGNDKFIDNLKPNKRDIKFLKTYVIVRYIVFAIILINFILRGISYSVSYIEIILIIGLFLITSVRKNVGKFRMPFGYILSMLDSNYRRKKDMELAGIIIQLQNIVVSQENEPTTLTFMLSRVVRFANYTKEAFLKMIYYIDQGKEEMARNAFENEIGTELSRDLAYILVQMDRIEPLEVIKQLKFLEQRLQRENLTIKNNSEEFYSNVVYVVPTLLCFMILLNFLMIILNLVTSNSIIF